MSTRHYKIYRYRQPWQLPPSLDIHPGDIIFPEQLNRDLPKQTIIELGERRQSIYYDRYRDGEYLDPIIKVDYVFNRDERGFVFEKVRTISWCLEDGTWSQQTQKDFIPVVSQAEQITELKRRRENIINELKGLAKKYSTTQLPLEAKILEVFEANQVLINSYIDAGSPKFRDAISISTEPWLDEVVVATGNTSRDILLSYLSIGLAN